MTLKTANEISGRRGTFLSHFKMPAELSHYQIRWEIKWFKLVQSSFSISCSMNLSQHKHVEPLYADWILSTFTLVAYFCRTCWEDFSNLLAIMLHSHNSPHKVKACGWGPGRSMHVFFLIFFLNLNVAESFLRDLKIGHFCQNVFTDYFLVHDVAALLW